jgi:hypothetical protein
LPEYQRFPAPARVLPPQRLLGPLLAAYDGRIASLEAELRNRTDNVADLKNQVQPSRERGGRGTQA